MHTIITRRGLLGTTAAALPALVSRAAIATQENGGVKELVELTAVEAVGAMQRGELRAEAYARALLAQAERSRHLNAFITLEPERVLDAARAADHARASGAVPGPLHGLPIPVKDSIDTRDLPTTGGTPALRNFRPKADAPVVARLRDAGALVMGKTNIHELSFGWTSNNRAFGAVRNPYDPTRVPGGSTGGTAAAIAARVAPLGVAEDTQGSIRVPAALCGIAGFRPSTGRYPTSGVVPITALFDQVGPHARSVADLVLFDTVVADRVEPLPSASLRGLRLGVDRGWFFDGLDPEVERITTAALEKLVAAGVELVEAPVPDLGRLISLTTAQIQLRDVAPSLRRYLAEHDASIDYDALISAASPDIRDLFAQFVPEGSPLHVTDAVYAAARDTHLPALRETFRRWFAETRVAALIFPTVRVPASTIGEDWVDIAGTRVRFDDAVGRNIASGSTAGLPGLVLPTGLTTSGLPVSLEFDGPAGSDRALLALGLEVERVLGPIPGPRSVVR